jgi:hypothetical protein
MKRSEIAAVAASGSPFCIPASKPATSSSNPERSIIAR